MSDPQSSAFQTLSLAEIEALADDSLRRAGATSAQARPLARRIARAESEGLRLFGLDYLLSGLQDLRLARANGKATPALAQIAPALWHCDGGDGFIGAVVDQAIAPLAASARQAGVALLSIGAVHAAGASAHLAEDVARHGVVGLSLGTGPAVLAAAGRGRPIFGAEPIALAIPEARGQAAVIFDITPAQSDLAQIEIAATTGERLPLGAASDDQGRPTTNPRAALEGALLPDGAAGLAWAILAETLMASCGAGGASIDIAPRHDITSGPPRHGHCLLAIAPRDGGHGQVALDQMGRLLAQEEAIPPPLRQRRLLRESALSSGVRIPTALLEQIITA